MFKCIGVVGPRRIQSPRALHSGQSPWYVSEGVIEALDERMVLQLKPLKILGFL